MKTTNAEVGLAGSVCFVELSSNLCGQLSKPTLNFVLHQRSPDMITGVRRIVSVVTHDPETILGNHNVKVIFCKKSWTGDVASFCMRQA